MKEEQIEFAKDYCPKDCVYRVLLDGWIPACYYAAIEHQVRGCKISECNRYRSGQPIKPTMDGEYMIYWEYIYYDEVDNSVW